MPSHEAITAAVSAAVEAHPFPGSLSEADAQTQRRITREAESLGLDPAKLYEAQKANAEASLAFDPDAIAAEARR